MKITSTGFQTARALPGIWQWYQAPCLPGKLPDNVGQTQKEAQSCSAGTDWSHCRDSKKRVTIFLLPQVFCTANKPLFSTTNTTFLPSNTHCIFPRTKLVSLRARSNPVMSFSLTNLLEVSSNSSIKRTEDLPHMRYLQRDTQRSNPAKPMLKWPLTFAAQAAKMKLVFGSGHLSDSCWVNLENKSSAAHTLSLLFKVQTPEHCSWTWQALRISLLTKGWGSGFGLQRNEATKLPMLSPRRSPGSGTSCCPLWIKLHTNVLQLLFTYMFHSLPPGQGLANERVSLKHCF